MNRFVVSIYFGWHDSCVTFADRDKVLLHLEAERVYRRKHMCFTSAEEASDLVKVGLDYLERAPCEITEVLVSRWNGEDKVTDDTIQLCGRTFPVVHYGHHEAHIGTTLSSGFEQCLVLIADGGSEDGESSLYLKSRHRLHRLVDLSREIATGKYYGTLTQMIICPDFKKAHSAFPGKTMGLSGMGTWNQGLAELLDVHKHEINQLHFTEDNAGGATGCSHLNSLFGLADDGYLQPWRDQRRCDLAYTGQEVWIAEALRQIGRYQHLSSKLSLAGGCALNIVLNRRLFETGWFKDIYVSPVASDCGQSLGALL